MKKTILPIAFFLLSSITCAQDRQIKMIVSQLADKDQIVCRIDSERWDQHTPIHKGLDHPKMLVSYYTWKTLCKADFSTLTGLDNSATVGKYAALNINQATSVFTFSPIIINPSVVNKNFNFIQSVDFSGSVDKTSILDLKNWRNVSLSYSVSWIFNKTYKFVKKPAFSEYKQLYDELELKFLRTYLSTLSSKLNKLNHGEFDKTESLHQAWVDSVARYEKLMIKDTWTSKNFGWIKLTASALSFDNATYVVTGDTLTYASPLNKAYYTPSLLVSFNYYWALHSGWNFYISTFVQGSIKGTFTDVFSTTEWNKNSRLTDSASIKKDSKSVYLATDANIHTAFRPNIGIEGIMLFPSSAYLGAGIDVSMNYNGLISNETNKTTGWLQNVQMGFILSFKDKSGNSTINIEPYYQDKRYRDYRNDASHLWGVKLSIPFTRLY